MQVLSFKSTALFKRGIWLSGAALLAFVAAPAVQHGSLRQNPGPVFFVLAALCACFAYFLRKTQIHRLVDEVLDCIDHLKVRRGRTEEIVYFSNIADARVATGGGIHRITIHLRQPTGLGAKIEFLPQASLWSNPAGVKRVAANLTERAS
jgi:uncharacterized OsmC-like protein